MLPFQQAIANSSIQAQLPDAPHAALSAAQPVGQTASERSAAITAKRPAPRFEKYINPDQSAVPLTAKEKLQFSVLEQLRPYSLFTPILAAGWEHLVDSNPRYGSDKAGFGERLGAAVIRQTSQTVLSDGVFAAAFRQDPRYYRKGSGKFMDRAIYSATRILETRTDAGIKETNYSELFGYAGAAALTMTYYPDVSATWPKTAQGYIVSLGASALGNEVHEFLPDVIHLVFHRHGN